MDILDVLRHRYSAKVFDKDKKIPDKLMYKLEEALSLTPSSYNLQPWVFFVLESDEAKEAFVQCAEGKYEHNKQKILDCDKIVLFTVNKNFSMLDVAKVVVQENYSGRHPNRKSVKKYLNGRQEIFEKHENELHDTLSWLENQVYIAVGSFLVTTASLGIDACPMDDLDMDVIADIFALELKGLKACCAVAIGYHKRAEDENHPEITQKSRLQTNQIFHYR